MSNELRTGNPVQTPLGKGVVVEVRNNGRVLVEVHGRSVLLAADSLTPARSATAPRRSPRERSASQPQRDPASPRRVREIDFHGMRVDDALARAEEALNRAMLDDVAELRLIHGRGGGRIRAALHARLRELPSVRSFRVDPRNEGVTIVVL